MLKKVVLLSLFCGSAQADTFQDKWMGRIAWPPADGIASRFDDRKLAREQYGNPSRDVLCAHPTERFDSVLVVTNLDNGKSVDCPIKDRGPFWKGRVIDLYPAADKAIACDGLCRVSVRRKGYE